jgi:flagellar protein FliS
MNLLDIRSRYVADTVATAGPSRLLAMLYDRLLLDVDRGERALRTGDRGGATGHLSHAQSIVTELICSLDVDGWDGAQNLLSIYTFLLRELVGSSVSGDAERVAACRALIEPLHEAWNEAGRSLTPVAATARTGELGVG